MKRLCSICKYWEENPSTSQWGHCRRLSNDNPYVEAYYEGMTIHGDDNPQATVDTYRDFGCGLYETQA